VRKYAGTFKANAGAKGKARNTRPDVSNVVEDDDGIPALFSDGDDE